MKKIVSISLLSVSLLSSGCMTTVLQVDFWTSETHLGRFSCCRGKMIFGGTRANAKLLVREKGYFVFPDFILCLIPDTLLLPLTIGQDWWLDSAWDQEGEPRGRDGSLPHTELQSWELSEKLPLPAPRPQSLARLRTAPAR